jgi:glycosyltransferase involved in cell wall biosynthesis
MEVWIGSFRDGRETPDVLRRAEEAGLPTLELSFELSSAKFAPARLIKLADRMRRRYFKLICTHGYKSNVIGHALSRLTGCPQIGFVRGWIAENQKVKQYEKIERWILLRTDWVVCVSELQARQLRSRRRGRPAPFVIPNAALLKRTNQHSVNRVGFRRQLGLQEDACWIGSVGRLSVEKGHRYLIEALPALRIQIPKLRLVVLGDGPERPRLERQVRRLGVSDAVYFAGFHNDVSSWMQAFDLLVNPSLTEGLPNVLLEAMALGTPVIATAVGAVPELLGDDRFGLVVPPGDSAALGRAVYQLASDPTGARQLVQDAYTRLDDYRPERQNQLLLDLYATVLKRSARASAERASGLEPRASYSQVAMEALARDGSSPDRRDSRARAWHERSGDQ